MLYGVWGSTVDAGSVEPYRWDEGEPWGFEYAGRLPHWKRLTPSQDSINYESWSETLSGRIQAELDALISGGNSSVLFDGDRYTWTGQNPLKMAIHPSTCPAGPPATRWKW